MKFLSFENEGHPVVVIKSNLKKINNKVIHLDDKARSLHGFNQLKLKGDDKFQLLPNPKIERSINYVCGSSGSGKTYFIKLFLIEYKKMFPKNQIYIFSPFDEDKSFDGVKINYIKIGDELLEDNLESKDFENSLCCFDDIEAVSNPKLRKEVQRIADAILTTGRHYNVSAFMVYHEPCNGLITKKTLNESHTITFFPKTLGGRSLKYLCDNYLGLDKEQINRIKKLKTRAITVIKGFPKVILSQKEIYCLGCEDDSSDSDGSSEDSDSDVIKYESKKKKKIKKKY